MKIKDFFKGKTKRIVIATIIGVVVLASIITPLIILSAGNILARAAANCDTIIIDAEYSTAAKTLTVSQTIRYTNRSEAMLDQIKFHIYANAYRDGAKFGPVTTTDVPKAYPNGKNFGGIEIKSVAANGLDTEILIGGEDENVLPVPLSSPIYPSETVLIEIIYEVALANIRHRLGYTEQSVNLGNFYPVPCVYENGEWQTYPYSTNGDPFYNDLHNFEVSIKCDKDLAVASSGTMISEKNDDKKKVVLFQSKAIRDFAMVLSKQFKTLTKLCDKIAVNYFYLDDTDPHASMATAVAALQTFSRVFAKYPYKQLSVVQTEFLQGGMEYGELVYISTDVTERNELDRVIVHEIAHQWWYGLVGNNQTCTAWIDEGLAEYSTLVFYDENPSYKIDRMSLIGNARSNYAAYVKIVNSINGEVDPEMNRDLNSFQSGYEYVFMTYVRGMLLFADLEMVVGKTNVKRALKSFATDRMFSFGGYESLVGHFEKNTKANLGLFFKSYLGGVPEKQ